VKIIVTAGPTREYVDSVRFLTNASSGKMGYACAAAAAAAGHEVTLITGPVAMAPPSGVEVVSIVSVEDLKRALSERFPACDALIMSAAVGDFLVRPRREGKIRRSAGPLRITLVPTEDILAHLATSKRQGQIVVAFAVEEPPPARAEAAARAEMHRKAADYVVVNFPAAMAADEAEACILSREGTAAAWARRTKEDLARRIVELVSAR